MIPNPLAYDLGRYRTAERRVSWFARAFPNFSFYRQFGWNVYRSSAKARRGEYDDREWVRSSHQVLKSLESIGVQLEISGIDHIRELKTPCVYVANHMSVFETVVLPAIIRPYQPVTFVLKQSLIDYPLFGSIVRTRDPIAVSREHPREDFKAVMQGGLERIKQGISIVVFPQTTRSLDFDPSQFNTIGVKLALRGQVPVVPIALVTDAWGIGKWLKDLGPIDPEKQIRIAFGRPIMTQGRGDQQHQEVIDFIATTLSEWRGETGSDVPRPQDACARQAC